jgi:hypothetical protein
MREDAARVRQTLAAFHAIRSTCQTIGFMTRVEIERLGTAGTEFGGLADDLGSLTEHVQEKVETVLETGSLLIPPPAHRERHGQHRDTLRKTGERSGRGL